MKKASISERIPKFVKNKYFIATVLFMVYILFVSNNNLIFTRNLRHEVNKLHKEEATMKAEIAADSAQSLNLKGNPEAIEKYGREHYYMRRADEDLFVIKDQQEKK